MANVDYDLVIIGSGPAGLTAGLYAARSRLKTVLFEKSVPGGQVTVTDWVENYPGFPEGISGADLVQKMMDQARHFGLQVENDEVQAIEQADAFHTLKLGEGEITAKAVIIASGASPRRLGVPGEDRFYGKGVSSCATCDGPFCKDKIVAAVGGGDTAVQESVYLTKFAKKVYLIHRRDALRADKILQERALSNDRIEVLWDTVLTEVSGLTHVEGVGIRNVKTGETGRLPVGTVFVWVGILPNADFLGDEIQKDEYGFIITNDRMETNIPGIYAVGDVRNTPLRQIATAVGDGALAASAAEHYIESLKT